jgi:hypothetical protein
MTLKFVQASRKQATFVYSSSYPVSAEMLARAAGISRVSVLPHANFREERL